MKTGIDTQYIIAAESTVEFVSQQQQTKYFPHRNRDYFGSAGDAAYRVADELERAKMIFKEQPSSRGDHGEIDYGATCETASRAGARSGHTAGPGCKHAK